MLELLFSFMVYLPSWLERSWIFWTIITIMITGTIFMRFFYRYHDLKQCGVSRINSPVASVILLICVWILFLYVLLIDQCNALKLPPDSECLYKIFP